MTTEVNTDDGTQEVPTATEFIPADETDSDDDRPMVRGLRATGDGGTELAYHEPHDDEVLSHVYACDECGLAKFTEPGIGAHLQRQHGDD